MSLVYRSPTSAWTVSGQLRDLRLAELLRGVTSDAVISLFISEILLTMEERLARGHPPPSLRVVLSVWKDLPKYWVACSLLLHRRWLIIRRRDCRFLHELQSRQALSRTDGLARTASRRVRAGNCGACLRHRRCCRCWRSAFPAPAPRRSCSAA
jgi:hypothetical protein